MHILAIETSCDDTGVSIIKTPSKNGGSFKVLSNIVASQIKVHRKYGGVYPMMAKREHQHNLLPVLKQALIEGKLLKISNSKFSIFKQAKNSKFKILKKILEREDVLYKQLEIFLNKNDRPKIDLIAVTNGPGLEPCLWVGVNFAKALSYFWNIPIVPVNHIEAHILVNFLNQKSRNIFPAISLVVSGGHTQLILVKGIGKYKIIGETRDDAAGECFDKCAKILGLEYPGGPEIARLAAQFQPSTQIKNLSALAKLPRPMISSKDYDFSFSGLKTAVLYLDKKTKNKSGNYKKEMAREIQQTVIDVLIKKTIKAVKDFRVKSIILGGGVSANQELRRQFNHSLLTNNYKLNLLVPPANLSTDNALMIAITGYFHKDAKIYPVKSAQGGAKQFNRVKAQANLRI